MNYSRIESSVDLQKLQNTHLVIVGAGGSYSLITSLARCGIGKLTVIDYDTVDSSNIVRQGYRQADIGKLKVAALREEIHSINPKTQFQGIPKDLLTLKKRELNRIFKSADVLLFLTDSFKAQAYGNILALHYLKPAIWAGWYARSQTCEVFFQIPYKTPACFRCVASSRYLANEKQQVVVSSDSNTIFHSQLLDSLIGMILLMVLHKDVALLKKEDKKEYHNFLDALVEPDFRVTHNFFQFKAHPLGGNSLFDAAYADLGKNAPAFLSYWQLCEPELKVNGYSYDCPDCKGLLNELAHNPFYAW